MSTAENKNAKILLETLINQIKKDRKKEKAENKGNNDDNNDENNGDNGKENNDEESTVLKRVSESAKRIYTNAKETTGKTYSNIKNAISETLKPKQLEPGQCPQSTISTGMNKVYSLFGDMLFQYNCWLNSKKKKGVRSVGVNAIIYKSITDPKNTDLKNILLYINTQGYPIFHSIEEVDDMIARIKVGKKIPREYAYTIQKQIIHNDKKDDS